MSFIGRDAMSAKFQKSLFLITEIITKQAPAVFIVMAVGTQVLPIGTIRGIIPVIAIFMVYGQEMPVFVSKLSPTFGTDKSVNLQ